MLILILAFLSFLLRRTESNTKMKLTRCGKITLGILTMVIVAVVIGLIVYFVAYGKYSLCLTSKSRGITDSIIGKIRNFENEGRKGAR